jgi:hypothetical protein
MSDKPHGLGPTLCDVCERRYTWGCGHTGSQEADARRHYATRAHQERRCWHFGHDYCDPKTCKLAGTHVPGYAPFHMHTEPSGAKRLSASADVRRGKRRSRSSRRSRRR